MTTVRTILRRSHAKSKNGCQTCKARRIKCDELKPSCQYCLTTRRTCTYPSHNEDQNSEHDESLLWWPASVEESVRRWKESGEPPFPVLNMPKSPGWHTMSMLDLRYLHQMALLASVLKLSKTTEMCIWWSEFPTFLQLAVNFDFVAHAMTAKSAARLALVTKSSEAFQDATQYHFLALRGMNQAIKSFSKDIADAILCASFVFQYQTSDWRGLMSITEGISAVARQMRPWVKESAFSHLLDEDFYRQASRRPAELTKQPSTNGDTNSRDTMVELLLTQGIDSLNKLASCLRDDPNLGAIIRQLRDVLRLVHQRLDTEWTVEDQYRLIHPFSAWMTRYSISFVAISERDSVVLVILAHMYAVVVVVAMALPAVDVPLFASLRVKGILETDLILGGSPGFLCAGCNTFHLHGGWMMFPLDAVHGYQSLWRAEHVSVNGSNAFETWSFCHVTSVLLPSQRS